MSLELKLTPDEIREMLARLDVSEEGLIPWSNYTEITTEVLLGMMMVRKTEIKFKNAEEEYFFLSDLMLFGDSLHMFVKRFKDKCEEVDYDNYGTLSLK